MITDLRKDATLEDMDSYVKESGRNWIDGWLTRWTFRHMLLKRAYTADAIVHMAEQSRFGGCQITTDAIGIEASFAKSFPTRSPGGLIVKPRRPPSFQA